MNPLPTGSRSNLRNSDTDRGVDRFYTTEADPAQRVLVESKAIASGELAHTPNTKRSGAANGPAFDQDEVFRLKLTAGVVVIVIAMVP